MIVVVTVGVHMAWLSMRWVGKVVVDDVVLMTVGWIVTWVALRWIVGIGLFGSEFKGRRNVTPVELEVSDSKAIQVIIQVLVVPICFDDGGVRGSNRK